MAAALLVALPVVILYNFFLDDFIRGVDGPMTLRAIDD